MCYDDVISETRKDVSIILTLPYHVMVAHINNMRNIDERLYGKMVRKACSHYGSKVLIHLCNKMKEENFYYKIIA